MTRTQDFADQRVERSDHAGSVKGVGVTEVETDARWIGRDWRCDLECAKAFEPARDHSLHAREFPFRLVQRIVDLQHPPISIRIVGAGAVPHRSNEIGKPDESDDGRLVGAVPTTLHEPLCLTGLQREDRTTAEHPGTLFGLCRRRAGWRRC